MSHEILSDVRSFGGRQLRVKHRSEACQCDMIFAIYLPPAAKTQKVPALYYLSGLTCTDENFVTKAGAQRAASQHGLAIIAPDTSPRGDNVPDDPDGAYDFGLAAGFYVDATEAPWSTHYRMYTYVTCELPALVETAFPVDSGRVGIFGHSMGGHGALTIGLRHPDRYRSISAFAPICAPSEVPWGKKALGGYLGDDPSRWRGHDATALIEDLSSKTPANARTPLMIDTGTADPFLADQLKPERLEAACNAADWPLISRMQEGYDHSYYFIATFMDDHIAHHAKALTSSA